jgi:CRP/FNR family transcriptional regulator, anaerobic regulatory protein
MKSFKKFIETYSTFPADDWIIIENSFDRREIVKDELILAEGMICRYFYFLEEGLVRFFLNNEGNDLTIYFVDAPYCFSDKESLHNRVPAKINIQALSNCVVWLANYDKIKDLSKLDSWQRFTKKITHEIAEYIEQLMITSKILSAEDRYLKLLETHPDITDRVPLKHLAGFLGIAPQSLSRIRKKYQK